MRVSSVRIRGFRNIGDASFHPGPALNLLLGPNGQGKTSLVEALGYISALRSFRGSHVDELLGWSKTEAEIAVEIIPEDDHSNPGQDFKSTLKVVFLKDDLVPNGKISKTAFINGKPFKSSANYLKQRFGSFELGFHAIVFNPSDHELIRGEPALRRGFLDRVLTAENPEYLVKFQKYQKVLEQRNALLKSEFSNRREFENLLASYSEPLVELGAWITRERIQWLHRLEKPLQEFQKRIAPDQFEGRPFYKSSFAPEIGLNISNSNRLSEDHFSGQGDSASIELLERLFWKKLSDLAMIEQRTRTTGAGPHRDDWGLTLGDRPLQGHGSQGEVRSALLALKLAEISLFRDRTGHRPVLILDDFSSELDRSRREFLLEFLSGSDLQVFVTATEDPAEALGDTAVSKKWSDVLRGRKGKWFSVESGQVTENRKREPTERSL